MGQHRLQKTEEQRALDRSRWKARQEMPGPAPVVVSPMPPGKKQRLQAMFAAARRAGKIP